MIVCYRCVQSGPIELLLHKLSAHRATAAVAYTQEHDWWDQQNDQCDCTFSARFYGQINVSQLRPDWDQRSVNMFGKFIGTIVQVSLIQLVFFSLKLHGLGFFGGMTFGLIPFQNSKKYCRLCDNLEQNSVVWLYALVFCFPAILTQSIFCCISTLLSLNLFFFSKFFFVFSFFF